MATAPILPVDVVGVGLNATDTIIRLPCFPAFDSKLEYLSAELQAGGQVASAMVACQRWGLRARYIGKVGDDFAAEFQRNQFAAEGVEAILLTVPGCASQNAYILVDEPSGERTILWKRPAALALRPEELRPEWIVSGRALLVDGHDTAAAATAAAWARQSHRPVVADVDNLYSGLDALLTHVDYLITSREFPSRFTGESNLLRALTQLHKQFGCRVTGATLGREGAVAWDGQQFRYSPGFQVHSVDTTGAGDIFHGAFLFALLQNWTLAEILEFSCAAAALNCTAVGARGGIRPIEEIAQLMGTGRRHAPQEPLRSLLDEAGIRWSDRP
ncbi:MAG: carbohydrate kinase family protein [Firmicutes bacterium]|nr:carbohydrate kinase family protein [Bacillota bacterium]